RDQCGVDRIAGIGPRQYDPGDVAQMLEANQRHARRLAGRQLVSCARESHSTLSMLAGLAACCSYDPGFSVPPIAVAQHALVELAGGQTREFSLEIDRARTLLVRQMRPAEVHQFVYQIGVGLDAWQYLDHGLYLFAEILIRNAKYCRIRYLGMCNEEVLALLRIDIDPARNDHEGGTIGQIEKSVVGDIAHIADRAHGAVLR